MKLRGCAGGQVKSNVRLPDQVADRHGDWANAYFVQRHCVGELMNPKDAVLSQGKTCWQTWQSAVQNQIKAIP